MFHQKNKGLRNGLLVLISGTIWAGFFGLPKAMLEVWPIPWILIVVWVWLLVIVLHLILAEVSLSLPGHKTFVWMANALFPELLAKIASTTTVINFFIITLVYTLFGGVFLQVILSWLGIHIDTARTTLIFVWLVSRLSFGKHPWENINQKGLTILMIIGILIIILAWIFGKTDISQIPTNLHKSLLMYWVTLFAMSGIGTIPLLYEYTGKSALNTRAAIIGSGGMVIILALFFSLAVLAISWTATTDDAITGIWLLWGKWLSFIGSIIGFLAITNSNLMISEHLQKILVKDMWMEKVLSWRTVCILPFLIFLYFDPTLLNIISIWGSLLAWILFILVAILNIYLHNTKQKIKIIPMIKNDQFRSRVMIGVCLLGVIYQILSLYN